MRMVVQVPSLGAEVTDLYLQGFWAGQVGPGEPLLMGPQPSSPNPGPSDPAVLSLQELQDSDTQGSCRTLQVSRAAVPKDDSGSELGQAWTQLPSPHRPQTVSIIFFPSLCHFSAWLCFSFSTHRDGLKPKAIYSNYAEGCLQIMQQITLDLEKKNLHS